MALFFWRRHRLSSSNIGEDLGKRATEGKDREAAFACQKRRRYASPCNRNRFMKSSLQETLLSAIRTIPDYPKPGIMFRDITTLLGDARAFRRAIDELVYPFAGAKIDKIAGIEARGFILGGAVAHQMSAGFIP